MKIATIRDTKSRYYIYIKNLSHMDIGISNFLGITINEYQNILNDFNGYQQNDETFFYNRNDCQSAINWIEENLDSLLLAKKISGG